MHHRIQNISEELGITKKKNSKGEFWCCLFAQSCPTLCNPTDCSLPGTSVHEDFAGKNTGVGCHALLQGIFPTQGLNPGFFTVWATREAPEAKKYYKKNSVSLSVVSNSWQHHGLQPARLLCPCNSPGKNTGMGSHSLLQGHLPNPGIKPGSPAL